ncbi:UNVERIFIED_CONTAM: hypothetical protein NCL1_40826 [Trichonephila clavipes]
MKACRIKKYSNINTTCSLQYPVENHLFYHTTYFYPEAFFIKGEHFEKKIFHDIPSDSKLYLDSLCADKYNIRFTNVNQYSKQWKLHVDGYRHKWEPNRDGKWIQIQQAIHECTSFRREFSISKNQKLGILDCVTGTRSLLYKNTAV